MILYVNELSATFALMMVAMVAWGYRSSLRLRVHSPSGRLVQALAVVLTTASARMAFYDLVRPAYRAMIGSPLSMDPQWQVINASANLAFALGCFLALDALVRQLPIVDRPYYSWWNVAWYPRRSALIRRMYRN